MTPTCPEHWTNRFPNLVTLRPGDVVKALGGYCAVVRVNECNARVLPLGEPEKVTVTTRFGRQWQVTERAKAEPIAAEVPPEAVVERRGAAWLEQFLKAVAPRREVRPVDGAEQTTTTNDNERNDSMPRTKKTGTTQPRDRRKDRGGLASEAVEPKRAKRADKSENSEPKKTIFGFVFPLLDGTRTKAEIAGLVAAEFKMDEAKALKRVNDAPFYARKAGLDPKWKAADKPAEKETE